MAALGIAPKLSRIETVPGKSGSGTRNRVISAASLLLSLLLGVGEGTCRIVFGTDIQYCNFAVLT